MHPAVDEPLAITTAIPRTARACYELFCDAARLPEWVSVVKSAVVETRNVLGRPIAVACLASFTRATVGYTLLYRYDEADMTVRWKTRGTGVHITGYARLQALSDTAALMTYDLDVRCRGILADWSDPFFQGHAASSVMNDFRDFATRAL